jgi:uncharacterized protein YcbX
VHVTRIGFTPLKGGRHVARPAAEIGPAGPVGDRVFCLVDPARDAVLRTVANPALVRAVATLDGDRLDVDLDGRVVSGVPAATGDVRKVDYWGRTVEAELLTGPWAAPLSELVGTEVALARPVEAGDVVYGGSVSLVTTGSLHALAARVGRQVAGARFRPTFVVDTGDLPAGCETSWAGRELSIGSVVLRVRGLVPRCAVVDLDPDSGARDLPVLRNLPGYGRGRSEPCFGVDADVVHPGRVSSGDSIVLGRS